MVGNDTHRYIRLLICTILDAREGGDCLDDWRKDVGIVVRGLALQCHTETLEAHPCINYTLRKGLKRAICLAVVLHEDKVPNLNDLWMPLINERKTRDSLAFLFATDVNMYLRARATWTLVTHLPEVIMLIPIEDTLLREVLSPNTSSLIITP